MEEREGLGIGREGKGRGGKGKGKREGKREVKEKRIGRGGKKEK